VVAVKINGIEPDSASMYKPDTVTVTVARL